MIKRYLNICYKCIIMNTIFCDNIKFLIVPGYLFLYMVCNKSFPDSEFNIYDEELLLHTV